MSFEFRFPDVGEGITEGELVSWKTKEGDRIREHDTLCEIETDKAIVEIPSPKAGVILKLHYRPGETVKVGAVLVTIGEEGEEKEEGEKAKTEEPESVSVVGELPKETAVLPKRDERDAVKQEILAVPAVRKLAKALDIDLSGIRGSGPEGRITEADVRARQKDVSSKARQESVKIIRKYDMYGYVERIPLRGVRKAIAKNVVKSLYTAPHVTHMDEADVTLLVEHREREKQRVPDVHLTYLPFVIKAVVAALRKHPYVNASLDDEAQEILVKKYYNIGIAVDTPDGLIVPVIKIADSKSILQLAKEVQELAEKAARRTLDLADLKGGTFTITNIGVYGGTHATPIISWPEVAILATGRIQEKPVARGSKIEIRKIMPLSLAFDHRVIDGAEAARFVNDLKKYLEDPDVLLVGEQ